MVCKEILAELGIQKSKLFKTIKCYFMRLYYILKNVIINSFSKGFSELLRLCLFTVKGGHLSN